MPSLEDFIRGKNVSAELIEKGSSQETLKAHELLRAQGINVEAGQMIKALVCIPLEGKEYRKDRAVLAMVAGPDKLDLAKLAKAAGCERIMIADPATAESLSGYPRGGTPPFGHAEKLRIILDATLGKNEVLFGGGGETTKVIRITPQEIRRIALLEGLGFAEADIRQ